MLIWKQGLMALLVLVLGAGAWVVWHPQGENLRLQLGMAAEAEVDSGRGGWPGARGGAPTVVGAAVETGTINDRLTAIGDGQALRSVTVNPEVSGRIQAVLKRSGERVESGDVLAQLDDAAEQIALDRATLSLRDAQTRLDRLQRQRGTSVTDAEVSSAESDVENARLQLRDAELAVARRTIAAPFDGILGIIALEPGSFVTSQTEVARIDQRHELLVEFRVPERFVSAIAVGDTLDVTPVSNTGQRLQGTVSAVDSRLEADSRTLRIQASVNNADDRLRPGMSFRVAMRFPGETYPAVNPLAIQWRSDGPYVWRVSDGTAQQVPVRIIQRNSDSVLVDADLDQGQQVVTEGVQSIRPGASVELAEDSAGPTGPTS